MSYNKVLAIIPARANSKGVPGKNIRDLAGKPLLAYSIETALQSKVFDEVMVSTEDSKYKAIAERYGTNVPFLRSDKNASDQAATDDVIAEVLEKYKTLGREFDAFCILQPTSPLRSAQDIKDAFKLFNQKSQTAVISVCEVEHPISWCGALGEEGSLNGFIKRGGSHQRQGEEIGYRINGAIYFVSVQTSHKDKFLYRDGSYAYIMPKERSVDIDTEMDFKFADFLMQQNG